MKTKYEELEMEVIAFEAEDIICESSGDSGEEYSTGGSD